MSSNSPYPESNSNAEGDNWDLPNTTSHQSRTPSKSVFPKTILHGLAALLVVSLCIVLVELNMPGTASRLTGSILGQNKPRTVAIRNNNPVPAPFLANKLGNARGQILQAATASPTTEPSTFPTPVPTSEPSAFPTPSMTFQPTSEPSKIAAPTIVGGSVQPTSEPSIFPTPVPTTEPSAAPTPLQLPGLFPAVETVQPTADPTTFPTPESVL